MSAPGMSRATATGRLAAGFLSRLAALAVLAVLLASVTVLLVLPRASGGRALTVLTGSMTPEIGVGSLAFIRPVDTDTLRVGDIATYEKANGALITHRVARINRNADPVRFTFKGDANKGADIDPVLAPNIRGKLWFHVPYLGGVRDAFNGRAGLSLLAVLVLAGYAVSQVFGVVKDSRTPNSMETRTPLPLSTDRYLVVATLRADPEALQGIDELRGTAVSLADAQYTCLFAPDPAGLKPLLRRLDGRQATYRVLDGTTSGALLRSTAPGVAPATVDVASEQSRDADHVAA